MKRIYITIIFWITIFPGLMGQGIPGDLPEDISTFSQTVTPTDTVSYLLRRTYLQPVTSYASTLKTGEMSAEILYFDGLGRPLQQVGVKSGPSGSDMVTLEQYDLFDRPEKQWLAYAKASNNGAFVSRPVFLAAQSSFLTGLYGSEDGSKGYAVTGYEKSPLNRVEKQGAPGADWQLERPVTIRYRTNTSGDNAQSWRYTGDACSAFSYPSGSLSVKETTDEDGNTTGDFLDRQGRLVMQVTGSGSTRYCYDGFGRLRCVVQPEGSSPADTENCFYYKYDERGRLTDKRDPGSQWVFRIYDSRDREVLAQDGNQRYMKSPPEWSYTLYDSLNRPVERGVWVTSQIRSLLEDSIEGNLAYMWGRVGRETLQYLHYNNYQGLAAVYGIYAADTTALGVKWYPVATDRLTWIETWLLNYEDSMDCRITTAYYYDRYGRVIQTVSDNHLNGKDIITRQYNFTGQPIRTKQRHNADGVTTCTELFQDYDHRGRPVRTRHLINAGDTVLTAGNRYDETGNLAVQWLHSVNNGSSFLQKNDYLYNIRGWLSQLNNPASLSGDDKFAMKLEYNTVSALDSQKFNGNIGCFTWSTPAFNQAKYYYSYDANNRLTQADFFKSGISSGALDVRYAYDGNGNITALHRHGASGSCIDSIRVVYMGNRIIALSDTAGDIAGTVDYPGTPYAASFNYDMNGNVTIETQKLIETGYNRLNLPQEVSWLGQNRRISYYYTFDGVKLRRKVEDNGVVTGIDYCGPFVYETVSGVRSLKYVVTPQGRAVKSGSCWIYEYNLADHLGNVRSVIRTGAGGMAEVVQERHYYPFGMEISGLSTGSSTNKYLYNGKEIQDDFNLYWYDYGARFYDPMLGRFHSVDRFAEKYISLTPYHYAANNPIYYIDVNGDSLWITHNTGFLGLGGKQTLLYENGDLYNKDGSAYTGKVKGFLSKSVNTLSTISDTQEGRNMVEELQSSANNFTLVKGDSKFTASSATKAYANQIQIEPAKAGTFQALQNAGVNFAGGSGGTISWNPSGATLPTLNGSGINGTTDLAHEMFHGLDANRGLLDNRVDQGLERSEWQAVYRENMLRSQLGNTLRTHYIKTVDASGAFISGFGPRMLTPANQPILPTWYTP